jgi:hypothetical protein
MNNPARIILMASLAAISIPALADDAPSARPIQSPKAQMNDCMAKQRAANNGMSEKAMRKACEDYLQTLENHPSMPAPPPAPTPPPQE